LQLVSYDDSADNLELKIMEKIISTKNLEEVVIQINRISDFSQIKSKNYSIKKLNILWLLHRIIVVLINYKINSLN
jgi:hypothetical protein